MKKAIAIIVFGLLLISSNANAAAVALDQGELKLIILNLSTVLYARFELIFDWTIDYKSVDQPIELLGLVN